MKKLLLALLSIASFQANASDSYLMMPYTLIYDSVDQNLNQDQALYLFDLTTLDADLGEQQLIYSIDGGENLFYPYSAGDTLAIHTVPGAHSFQFYAGQEYAETRLMQLEIKGGHRSMYRINFSRAYKIDALRKPVIYLYPEETTDVSIKVDPVGEFTFTYPNIDLEWNFACEPYGTLKREEEAYRYLFWESEQDIPTQLINKKEGVVLSGTDAVEYLEIQMQQFGMTSEERADFITYWGPILQTKSNLYIYLLFNEVCDAFASLEISPKPTQIGRFYVLWATVPDNYNPSLESQEVPKMQRDGFTVLEWGGAEVNASKVLLEDF